MVFGRGSPSRLTQVEWSLGSLEAGDLVLQALSGEAWVRASALTTTSLRVSWWWGSVEGRTRALVLLLSRGSSDLNIFLHRPEMISLATHMEVLKPFFSVQQSHDKMRTEMLWYSLDVGCGVWRIPGKGQWKRGWKGGNQQVLSCPAGPQGPAWKSLSLGLTGGRVEFCSFLGASVLLCEALWARGHRAVVIASWLEGWDSCPSRLFSSFDLLGTATFWNTCFKMSGMWCNWGRKCGEQSKQNTLAVVQ